MKLHNFCERLNSKLHGVLLFCVNPETSFIKFFFHLNCPNRFFPIHGNISSIRQRIRWKFTE